MQKKIVSLILAMAMVVLFNSTGFSEALTPALCKEKVIAAVELLKAKGDSAFPEIKDPNGAFVFAGGKGYVWIHNLDGIMILHPIKPALEGKAFWICGTLTVSISLSRLMSLPKRKVPDGYPMYGRNQGRRKFTENFLCKTS